MRGRQEPKKTAAGGPEVAEEVPPKDDGPPPAKQAKQDADEDTNGNSQKPKAVRAERESGIANWERVQTAVRAQNQTHTSLLLCACIAARCSPCVALCCIAFAGSSTLLR